MLKVPQLDDMTYEQIMQRSVGRIPGMTEQWTDFNYHDPGITVLSTYAWLVDMLNYYMNATGDIHILKYLKLLGLHQHSSRHADAYMGIRTTKESVKIPKGMRMYAGDTCFEAAKSQEVAENLFQSYISEIDGKGMDLTTFAGVDGEYADLFSEDLKESAIAYMGFEKELSGQVMIQICVKENENRAPFDDDFFMSSLTWQYYGSDGWKDIKNVTDLTNGFLRNGMVYIDIPDNTVPFKHKDGEVSAHYIRCILNEYTYDVLPKLGNVSVNPFLAEQKRSISKMEEVVYQGESEILLPFYVPEHAYLLIGLQEDHSKGRLLFNGEAGEKQYLEIKEGNSPFERILVFPQDETMLEVNSKLMVFCLEESFQPDFRQGLIDGCANQEIYFPYPDLYEIGVSTWTKSKDACHSYEIWNYTSDLTKADYMDPVFTYDFEQKKIIFGDGIHGKVPHQGQYLCISKLSVSKFSQGNVLEGEINRVVEEEDLYSTQENAPYQILNLQKASKGRDLETVPEMIMKLEQVLFSQRRLVSPDDYKKIVKLTPGLLIESVTVLSGEKYAGITGGEWDKNEVVVVVKPYSEKLRPPLSEYYKEKILEHIEDKRLINTKVTVVSPTYVGIEVHGRIRLTSLGKSEQQEVLSCIENMIRPAEGENGFGRGVILGKIYAKLEMLKQVRQIHELSLERTGAGAVKNQRGDILLEERSLSYIKTIEIEFC